MRPSGVGRFRLSQWHLSESGFGIRRESFNAGGGTSGPLLCPPARHRPEDFTQCQKHFTSYYVSEALPGLTAALSVPIFHSSFFSLYPVPPPSPPLLSHGSRTGWQGCTVATGYTGRGWGCPAAREEPAGVHHRAGMGGTLWRAPSPCTTPGCPGPPPGRARWGVLLSGARPPHQDALRWLWKRLSPHGCSLMEPASLQSPVPLGSGSPANAALRGARGLRGVGVRRRLLRRPVPSLGGGVLVGSAAPVPRGRGENPRALLAAPGKSRKAKWPLVGLFPALFLPFPEVRFSRRGGASRGGVAAGRLWVPVTLWGLLSPLPRERPEPVAGSPPRWALPGGDIPSAQVPRCHRRSAAGGLCWRLVPKGGRATSPP